MILVIDIKKNDLIKFMQYIDVSYSGGSTPDEVIPIASAINESLKKKKRKQEKK